MKVLVLGAGMVGSTMALDLAKDFEVSCFDINSVALEKLKQKNNSIQTQIQDLRKYEDYPNFLKHFDIVVLAVPGFMGFDALKTIVKTGKKVVDISFFPEDGLQLDALAKENNSTAIIDCGVAPGMSNWIIGYHNSFEKINEVYFVVGGLPKNKIYPWEYKAPFSPIDVIEEYTRPARIKLNNEIITKPALSDANIIYFEETGELEAFNTDGLRSLLFTMPNIPTMLEQTLRYPGHIDLIKKLKASGFFETDEIKIGNHNIKPIDVSAKLLLNQWKLEEDEEEFTVMQVNLFTEHENKKTKISYYLYDEYDETTKCSSMSRTTGYTATATVHMLAKNMITEKGVFPPELVAHKKDCFDFLFDYLNQRNVKWKKQTTAL